MAESALCMHRTTLRLLHQAALLRDGARSTEDLQRRLVALDPAVRAQLLAQFPPTLEAAPTLSAEQGFSAADTDKDGVLSPAFENDFSRAGLILMPEGIPPLKPIVLSRIHCHTLSCLIIPDREFAAWLRMHHHATPSLAADAGGHVPVPTASQARVQPASALH